MTKTIAPMVAALAAATLAACATPAPRPVEVRIQERLVEVQRPCPIIIPDRPAALRGDDLPDDARDALRIAIAALLAWQGPGGYGERADAMMRICVDGGEAP